MDGLLSDGSTEPPADAAHGTAEKSKRADDGDWNELRRFTGAYRCHCMCSQEKRKAGLGGGALPGKTASTKKRSTMYHGVKQIPPRLVGGYLVGLHASPSRYFSTVLGGTAVLVHLYMCTGGLGRLPCGAVRPSLLCRVSCSGNTLALTALAQALSGMGQDVVPRNCPLHPQAQKNKRATSQGHHLLVVALL